MTEKRLAACRANVQKAQEAIRGRPMSPARRAALAKAVEANRRNWHLTPARLAAMRINVRKMQAASVAKFRMTEKRAAALRENIKKAQAAWRVSEKRKLPSYNNLKHGLFAKQVAESVARLGEDPSEFEAHRQLFAQVFTPQDDVERQLVRQVAETVWRRLRLFRAQFRWESDGLKKLVAESPVAEPLSAEETESRAYALAQVLTDYRLFFSQAAALESQIERGLRKLLRKRGGNPEFKVFSRLDPRRLEEPDAPMSLAEMIKILKGLGIERPGD